MRQMEASGPRNGFILLFPSLPGFSSSRSDFLGLLARLLPSQAFPPSKKTFILNNVGTTITVAHGPLDGVDSGYRSLGRTTEMQWGSTRVFSLDPPRA